MNMCLKPKTHVKFNLLPSKKWPLKYMLMWISNIIVYHIILRIVTFYFSCNAKIINFWEVTSCNLVVSQAIHRACSHRVLYHGSLRQLQDSICGICGVQDENATRFLRNIFVFSY